MVPEKWTENFIDLNGVHICYHRTGGNKPPIILLHGISDNGLCWTRVAKDLEKDFDVIMLDARGHGKSTAAEMEFGFGLMAADVAGLIQELKLNKPILLGHSMGGQVATIVAGKYPDLVSKIVLEDPAYFLRSIEKLLIKVANPLIRWMGKRNDEKTKEQVKTSCKKLHPTWIDDDLDPWVEAQKEFARNLKETVITRYDTAVDWHNVFSKVKVPVLFIIASKGVYSVKRLKKILPEFADAKFQFINEAGHNIRREQYEQYMDAVRSFVHA
nr:alpha/beta hydrolase [Candidatus Sigynarchaeota archaeon]